MECLHSQSIAAVKWCVRLIWYLLIAHHENFAPLDGVAAQVAQRALAHGVITRGIGDVVNLCPPLIITEGEIDELLTRIEHALDDAWAWVAADA